MKKFCLLLIIAAAVALLVSCGKEARVRIDESQLCQPHDLTIDSIGSGYARIAWNPGCRKTRILRGFNIYASAVPLTTQYPGREMPHSVRPINRETYPGDSEGLVNRETYELKGLVNAAVYYVHVRVVNSDNTLSLPTNEVELICYAQGELVLSPSYSDEQDGFSFDKNANCRTDDLENDIYFFHKNGSDFLCSPSRLSPVNRTTELYSAGSGNTLGDISRIVPQGNSSEKIELETNGIYIVVTAEGYPAKLRVKEIRSRNDSRKIVFEYIYKPPVKNQGAA